MSTLPDNEPECLERAGPCVELVIEARPRDIGSLVVARLLPSGKRRLVGPFIYLDRARATWKAQTFPKIPTDQDEFVPYPELHR